MAAKPQPTKASAPEPADEPTLTTEVDDIDALLNGDLLDLFKDIPDDTKPKAENKESTQAMPPVATPEPIAPTTAATIEADGKQAHQKPISEKESPAEPQTAVLAEPAASKEIEATLEKIEVNAEIDKETPVTESPAGYALPPELEQRPARGGFFSSFLWLIGILVMLGLQYLYYNRLVMAGSPKLRPLLEQMCGITECKLPPRRELSAIALGDHLVQSHPRYENSLLITATLLNRADFVQPYPILEVVMTDLRQEEIARRRFLPDEYLIGDHAPVSFKPDNEVPLMLEVLDPGKQAVGFEFNFY